MPTRSVAAGSFARDWKTWPGGYPFIREVRGLGLMIGAEIQDFQGRGEPNPRLRDWIIDLAFHRGLLLLPCGASTIRFCPPLCLTRRQVELGLILLDAAMMAAVKETNRLADELKESEARIKEDEQ